MNSTKTISQESEQAEATDQVLEPKRSVQVVLKDVAPAAHFVRKVQESILRSERLLVTEQNGSGGSRVKPR